MAAVLTGQRNDTRISSKDRALSIDLAIDFRRSNQTPAKDIKITVKAETKRLGSAFGGIG
jgi:hypothetical protein